MSIKVKGRGIACALLSLVVAAGLLAGISGRVSADEEQPKGRTVEVSSADEMTAALADKTVNHIIITQSFDVPCIKANNTNGTSFFTANRTMTIEGTSPDITLTRTVGDASNNGALQSIIGICGDGSYDGIQVSMFNLTLDGGADFGETKGVDRMSLSANAAKVAGRSVVDVYYKATLNLEDGLTIKNGYCTYSLTSVTEDPGSGKYGGGVRVDWETESGGGTVNVKAGSCIKNCVAGNYGGGIGSYSYSRLNVYGGIIEDCSSYYGGAVGCTWRARHDSTVSGTFRMYGGTIRNCSAYRGGAISADGHPDYCFNALYGGTIDNCEAKYGGSALALNGGGGDGEPSISIAPYSNDGPLFITNCPSSEYDTSPDVSIGDGSLGYSGIDLRGNTKVVTLESAMCSVVFKKFKDDVDDYAVLSIKTGTSLGESFPADPSSYYTFIGWNVSPDGKGKTVTKDFKFDSNMTVYARWLTKPEFTQPERSVTLTYGDLDKKVEIKDAVAPYGGEISYVWVKLFSYEGYMGGNPAPGVYTNSIYQFPKLPVGNYEFYCDVYNSVEGYGKEGKMSDLVILSVEPKEVSINWSDLAFIADGKVKLPKATISGVLDGDDCTVVVSGEQTSAGKYIAVAKLDGKDSGNYVIATGDESKEFIIAAPTATATPTAAATPTAPATPTATATPVAKPSKTPAKPTTAEPTKVSSVTLTLDKNTASVVCGKTVSLKATLKGSSAKISWKSSDTKVATVDAYGKVTTKMAGTVTITASAAGKSATATVTALYKDVTNPKDFWYAPTNYLTGKGVVKGYANQTEFRPANNCTRAQMVTFIWRLQGEPKPKAASCKFSDVKKSDYFYKACIWGNENHIVEGYKDGTFGPQIVCARKHAVTFPWRLANKPSPKSKENKFKDVKTSDYFYTATLWASEKGILAGYDDGTFRPDGDCLRRQMVTFLYKYDKYVNGKG